MEKPSKQILGVILICAGLALTVLGMKMLFGPNQYSATTTLSLENHVTDQVIPFSPRNTTPQSIYSQTFIETTFEIIRSRLVLSNVIVNLDLNRKWGAQAEGGPNLLLEQNMIILQKHLTLSTDKNANLISITYTGNDPNETALIANAIAEGYLGFRLGTRNGSAKLGLKILQEKLLAEEEQISLMQTNVEQLRQQFGIQNDTVTDHLREQQPYWEAKQRLEGMLKNRDTLQHNLSRAEFDSNLPRTQMVRIVDRAESPKSPSGPNRVLGAVEAALGLLLLCGGVFLIKPARN